MSITPSRKLLRKCSIFFGSIKEVERLALILNEVAKRIVFEITLRKLARRKVKRSDIGGEWYSLCQDLLKVWIHEASMSMLEQVDLGLR